ncbi:MAG TPA: NAD(P)H-dependent oxidoreductase [Ramlibacter sp.]|jgi:FMN-dependent NADH-azoreductase|uniref:FMN-dependent NADH-azoreductase n=1 Tax=Ramlibacter sp. TaxID=1917967 RepID=UPI002D6E26EC|nr:NAD(P)H-dependent oxidoreductase [Ramlibacter sp.]HZY18819.1 NAD(P)H-dependent oxidoreductase [Ramlibacter sp.]
MKLLHIDSSPLGQQSVSRQLTARVVRDWVAAHPGTQVEHLDLVVQAPRHLDMDSLGFRLGIDAAGLTDAQRRENEISERLVSQFLAADVVVVGAPMYNFSVPSQLKAWIDRVAQAGRTFRYTEAGPRGLAGGKKVIVVSTRGGAYAANPGLAALDHQESYLRAVFGFFGIDDVSIVRAEGLAMGDAAKAKALAGAEAGIGSLLAPPANEPGRLAA